MQMKKFVLFIGVLLCLATHQANGAEASLQNVPPYIGSSIGVQIKEWWTKPEDLDAIKDAGFSTVRFVIPWPTVEHEKNTYDWRKFDAIMQQIAERNMQAIIVLAGGNAHYSPTVANKNNPMFAASEVPTSPSTPEAIAGFVAFARATVARYEDKPVIWEIWNEPDLKYFWHPQVDASAYARLADATCRAIREVKPHAKVIGPAAADFPAATESLLPQFWYTLIRSPAIDCFDAISIHPYRGGKKNPESVSEDYQKLRTFLRRNLPHRDLPIIASEWGYSTTKITSELQAAYALRTILINQLNNIELSIWYEWRDSRNNGEADAESNFGLRRYNNEPKPGWMIAEPILARIHDSRLIKRIDVDNSNIYVLLLQNIQGSRFIVAWTVTEKSRYAQEILLVGEGMSAKEYTLSEMPQIISSVSFEPIIRTQMRQ